MKIETDKPVWVGEILQHIDQELRAINVWRERKNQFS